MMTEGNVRRLVTKLTQMRGAALKLGQFMSIQGQSASLLAMTTWD
jgi:aarF domain-containing kinase